MASMLETLGQADLAGMSPMQRAIYKNALMIGLVTPPWAQQWAGPQQASQGQYQWPGHRMMFDSPQRAGNTGPGAYSTEYSTTTEAPGGYTNVPSMWGGRVMPGPVATAIAKEAGWPTDVIKNVDYADQIAADRSHRIGMAYARMLAQMGNSFPAPVPRPQR